MPSAYSLIVHQTIRDSRLVAVRTSARQYASPLARAWSTTNGRLAPRNIEQRATPHPLRRWTTETHHGWRLVITADSMHLRVGILGVDNRRSIWRN
jgi:hypothetical protein